MLSFHEQLFAPLPNKYPSEVTLGNVLQTTGHKINLMDSIEQRLQTTAPGSNPDYCLFLYGLQAKNGFYIFKESKTSKEELDFVIKENYMEFKFQCP